MTGPELQSRLVRGLEARFEKIVTAFLAQGMMPEAAHERAMQAVLRLQGFALEGLRKRGAFPFPAGEIIADSDARGPARWGSQHELATWWGYRLLGGGRETCDFVPLNASTGYPVQ